MRIANFDLSDKDKTGDIAKRFMITSFPTIKVFKRGAFHKDYTGVRCASLNPKPCALSPDGAGDPVE